MPATMTAKVLMTPEPIFVQPNADPSEILRIFAEKKFTALPVGTESSVMGVLSEMSLVKIMVQFSMEGKTKKIGDYMGLLEKATYVAQTAQLHDIVKAMVASTTHRVLVRDNFDKIVGILSPKDLLRVLSGEPA
ncbi:MAG: CBS domain-containing protein [Deltaproteobacteria bacterium]|nr:CBS domain-containing protein [Deltaproteobacteria bacterium]